MDTHIGIEASSIAKPYIYAHVDKPGRIAKDILPHDKKNAYQAKDDRNKFSKRGLLYIVKKNIPKLCSHNIIIGLQK